jgi:hypothetical protein
VEFVLTLPAFAGEPANASNGSHLQIFGSQRFCDDTCVLNAAVSLPSGAVIVGTELDAFDMDAAGRVRVRLLRCARGSRVCEQILAVGDTGDAATPGVVQVRFDTSPPHTVDNGANAYLVEILLTGGTSNTSIGQVRIFYQLQVSPAPAVATFSDVPPSHDFFRFIEALARSGITSGCGGGNFCPDAPLTRGQMAVFLAIGLGLHFAP